MTPALPRTDWHAELGLDRPDSALAAHLDRHLNGWCRRGHDVTVECEWETPGVKPLLEVALVLSALPVPLPRYHDRNREALIAAIARIEQYRP